MTSATRVGERLDRFWATVFWPRLAGLSDGVHPWEPARGCRSVRPAGEAGPLGG